tara:strand:+ start:916 stop:1236 length:321 start_codon:yes stop_codon:yes gene_type:complete
MIFKQYKRITRNLHMKDTTIITALGIAGSIGISISLMPQTYKSWTTNDITSLSIKYIIITLISSILMIIYSTYYLVYPMIIANLSVLGNTCILILLYYKNKCNLPS